MPRWVKSTQVVSGAVVAALSGLATQGFIDSEFVAAVNTLLGAAAALLRFRPGAGKPITNLQGLG